MTTCSGCTRFIETYIVSKVKQTVLTPWIKTVDILINSIYKLNLNMNLIYFGLSVHIKEIFHTYMLTFWYFIFIIAFIFKHVILLLYAKQSKHFDKLSESNNWNECQIHYRQHINISPSLYTFIFLQKLKLIDYRGTNQS